MSSQIGVQVVKNVVAGRDLVIETGLLALQADGAVTVRYGDSVVLVTACASTQPREGVDFLPLTVDYEERLYAAGKIPGGFIRREGRPTEDAILASRLTDRLLRPLFPKGFRTEVQVIVTVLSADQENDPDLLAVVGASSALTISSIPFGGPVSAVRMGYLDGKFVVNPTLLQLAESDLDLVVASTRDAIVMIEAGAREVRRELLTEAIKLGHEANQGIIRLQEDLRQACGKAKMEFQPPTPNTEVVNACAAVEDRLGQALAVGGGKQPREQAISAVKREILSKFAGTATEGDVGPVFEAQLKKCVRARILGGNQHVDGRRNDEIRPISCRVGLLPRTHGSGLFIRGQTQVLTITTLGSKGEEQKLDGIGVEETKRFMHHYNMPPYSNGEVKRVGSAGRREIGHGALVERAISKVIPKEEEFPYTIRLVSEVLSSNGSTSMASVCGASLSLMDAGVPIKCPVAGIAMGLVIGDDKYVVLTDIDGMEDACGDMDFKVAGTAEGITALQLDIKRPGLTWQLLDEALTQGCRAYLEVLEKIKQTIGMSRSETSRYAPRVYQVSIDPGKIGTVIGPGGKTIRGIIEKTKVTIDVADDGKIVIGSTSEESAQAAIRIIEDLTREVAVGSVYTGKVTRIMNFGAMVEILPGKEGLVHISELAAYRVNSVEDVVKVGDEVKVKVVEIDRMGRANLSRRAVLDETAKAPGAPGSDPGDAPPPRPGPRPSYGSGDGGRRPPSPGGPRPPGNRR